MNRILKEALVIFGLIFGFALFGETDTIKFLEEATFADFVTVFGLLWCIGAFFNLSADWEEKGVSLVIAIGITLFGHALGTYGFITSLKAMGGYGLILAYLTSGIDKTVACGFLIAGIALYIGAKFISILPV